jgi:hypothetical protein
MRAHGIDVEGHVTNMTEKFSKLIKYYNSFGFNGMGFGGNVKRMILQSFLRPVLEYGICLHRGGDPKMKPLQSVFNQGMRDMFSVPRSTSLNNLLALSGMATMGTRQEILQAKWMHRIRKVGDDCMIHHALK